jgi:hypothetical protein
MDGLAKSCLILIVVLALALPVYAQKNEALYNSNSQSNTPQNNDSFKDKLITNSISDSLNKENHSLLKSWFKSRAFAAPLDQNAEKKKSREQWQEFLGIDVFYPYFKAKEIENVIKTKTAVNFFDFKGKAEIDEGTSQVKYIFKKKF